MLIGHSMPAVSGVSLSDGTWLTADAGMACVDLRPTRRARFAWPAGSPTLGQYVAVTLTFAAASRLRVLAALGLSVPAGTRVAFVGPAGLGLGGCTDTRTRAMPDGSVGVFAVAEDAGVADASVSVRIYNDADGATWASEGTPVDIGELVAMDGVEIEHGNDWADGIEDPTEGSRTRASQINSVRRSPYRVYDIPLVATDSNQVRHGGLMHGQDWGTVRRALFGQARCVVAPRWKMGTLIDADALNATAIYGVGNISSARHLGGDYYDGATRFEEIPAR